MDVWGFTKMSLSRYYQLVEHSGPWPHYAIHEALYNHEEHNTYWVGSKAIRVYDTYHAAISAWTDMDPMSAEVDIMHIDDIQELIDRVDYSDEETELEF
jgi:hypothetical protein